MQVSAEKEMLTLFRDLQGSLLEHDVPWGTTVAIARYCDLCDVILNNVRPVIRSKHWGMISTSVWFQHDYARTILPM
jgi:hypothetical protein